MIGIIIDASMLYQIHADMRSVARDGSRRLAMGALDETQVQAFMTAELAQLWSHEFTVTASLEGTVGNLVSIVEIETGIDESSMFGMLSDFFTRDRYFSSDLFARIEMRKV